MTLETEVQKLTAEVARLAAAGERLAAIFSAETPQKPNPVPTPPEPNPVPTPPEPNPVPTPEPEPAPADDQSVVTLAKVGAAVIALGEAKGFDAAKALLAEHGVAKAGELKPGQYNTVIAAAFKASGLERAEFKAAVDKAVAQ